MCHESTSVALDEAIGIGKGSVSLEDIHHVRADRDRRPEPRHQPPADADRAGEGQEERRQDHRDQPAPRSRAGALQEPAEGPRPGRQGHRSGRPVPAGAGERRPRAVPGDRRAAARVGLRRQGVRRRVHHRVRRVGGARARPRLGRGPPRDRPGALADRGGGRDVRQLRGDHHLLGDGDHPAPQRRRDGQGDRQRRPAPGQHRQAGRRAVPGPRPLQRAGRPHDGHLGEAAGALPGLAARHLRLRAAARARPRHRGRDPGPARREGPLLHGHGRQLRVRRPRHRGDRGRPAQRRS